MSHDNNIMNKHSKRFGNNVLIMPCKEQNLLPSNIMTFEYHIKYLMECAEHDDLCVTHYFLEKAMESWNDINA